MAKHYTTVVVEGQSLEVVERCLASVIGPLLPHWRGQHLLGVHIDIADMSEAVRYGIEFESQDVPKPRYPVVEVDLYARRELATRVLEMELARLIAAEISERLGVSVMIRTSDS